jgi:hypothetical protein
LRATSSLCSGRQDGRQIPSQLDLKRVTVLVWREHDGVSAWNPERKSVAPEIARSVNS